MRHCSYILTVLLVFHSIKAIADEPNKSFYVHGGFGATVLNDLEQLTGIFEGFKSSLHLGGGYKFTSDWATELNYVYEDSFDIYSIMLEGVYSYPLTKNIKIDIKGGTQFLSSDDSLIGFDEGLTYTLGAGLTFTISPKWSINASTKFNGNDNVSSVNSLTVAYHF